MGHYDVRKWGAWHRYVTLCLLAYVFLAVTSLTTRNEEVVRRKGSLVRPDPADGAGGRERSARHGRARRREERLLTRVVGMRTRAPSIRRLLPEGESGAAKRALSAGPAVEDRARPSTTTLCTEEAPLTDGE